MVTSAMPSPPSDSKNALIPGAPRARGRCTPMSGRILPAASAPRETVSLFDLDQPPHGVPYPRLGYPPRLDGRDNRVVGFGLLLRRARNYEQVSPGLHGPNRRPLRCPPAPPPPPPPGRRRAYTPAPPRPPPPP